MFFIFFKPNKLAENHNIDSLSDYASIHKEILKVQAQLAQVLQILQEVQQETDSFSEEEEDREIQEALRKVSPFKKERKK